MAARYAAAAIQMHSTEDRQANLDCAAELVTESARQGARLAVLPEYFNRLGRIDSMVGQAESIPGTTSQFACALARRLKLTLLAGSLCEASGIEGKAYNTSLLIGPDGTILARYRKMHLFDVRSCENMTIQESKWILPGESLAATGTPLGVIGQATCYDLRFPELFRRLSERGAEVLLLPSAFTAPTGRAHWDVLVRARAIENQLYVVAANQVGRHTPELTTYGHSQIVDPWGAQLAVASADQEAVVMAEIDLEFLADVRWRLPALEHRKLPS